MKQVGDPVLYVPAIDHALERQPDGSFPYAVAELTHTRKRRGEPEEPEEDVPLTDEELFKRIRNNRGKAPEEYLKVLHPKVTWPAVVTGVHEQENLVDLDVKVPQRPETLHLNRVPFSDENKPHTWKEVPLGS